MDRWQKLWEIAWDDDGPIRICPHADHSDEVFFEYHNGEVANIRWDGFDWQFPEQLNTVPGDIAARDTL